MPGFAIHELYECYHLQPIGFSEGEGVLDLVLLHPLDYLFFVVYIPCPICIPRVFLFFSFIIPMENGTWLWITSKPDPYNVPKLKA